MVSHCAHQLILIVNSNSGITHCWEYWKSTRKEIHRICLPLEVCQIGLIILVLIIHFDVLLWQGLHSINSNFSHWVYFHLLRLSGSIEYLTKWQDASEFHSWHLFEIFTTYKRLTTRSLSTVRGSTASTSMMFLVYFEDILNARNLPQIRVINLFRLKHLHLLFGYEPALVSISLSCQILSTSISDSPLIDSVLFLCPISLDFVIACFVDVGIN